MTARAANSTAARGTRRSAVRDAGDIGKRRSREGGQTTVALGGASVYKALIHVLGVIAMALRDRLELYRQLEDHRKRPLIVYVTSPRPGAEGMMGGDVVPEFLDQLGAVPPVHKDVDLLVVSMGGDPTVAWRVMTLLRERFETIAMLVPQAAFSAATLIALGADVIVMHPHGNLGPTDPQIRTERKDPKTGKSEGVQFGAEDVSGLLQMAREDVGLTDQEHLRVIFENLCQEVGHVAIGFAGRAVGLSMSLGEKLLRMHMDGPEEERKIHLIVEALYKKFFVHGYPIGRKEAKGIGLNVAEPEPRTEELMWRIWQDIEADMQAREPFHPFREIENSPAGPLVFAPVPQANVPAGLQVNIQIPVVQVPPVPFSNIHGVLESPRLASHYTVTGKILAVRTPDLQIKVNVVATTQGWNRVAVPAV
ncbi:MAG: hypothetical protein NTW87_10165 [Planctomycetota bacterium]|nr:hypothetical protein [Planctomycetota bacterium]